MGKTAAASHRSCLANPVYFPAAHCVHAASSAAPAGADEPRPQSVHAADPDPALYLPIAQAAHTPPSGPVYPALHRHAVMVVLPADDWLLAAHASHVCPLFRVISMVLGV